MSGITFALIVAMCSIITLEVYRKYTKEEP